MGYRKDFEILLEEIFSSIKVSRIGHDDKAVKGNKPDFIIHKSGIPLLYIETKDIGVSLEKIEKSEQMKRYFGYVLMRKLVNTEKYTTVFLSNTLVDINFYGFQTYFFPHYTYSKDGTKIPNLNYEILERIEKTTDKTEPEEILDYIYAVLHTPTYRNKYKESLKIDFPRVPYPKDKNTFKELVKFGTELRQLHLLESPK